MGDEEAAGTRARTDSSHQLAGIQQDVACPFSLTWWQISSWWVIANGWCASWPLPSWLLPPPPTVAACGFPRACALCSRQGGRCQEGQLFPRQWGWLRRWVCKRCACVNSCWKWLWKCLWLVLCDALTCHAALCCGFVLPWDRDRDRDQCWHRTTQTDGGLW